MKPFRPRRAAFVAAIVATFGASGYLATAHKHDLTFACDVVAVADGDTWRCAEMVAPVRAWGIDAPDFDCKGRLNCKGNRRAAAAAKQFLNDTIAAKRLMCEGKHFDGYGRVVARCTLGALDIGCHMIRNRHAAEWTFYSGGAYRECRP